MAAVDSAKGSPEGRGSATGPAAQTVFVIDDDVIMLDAIARSLEHTGHPVHRSTAAGDLLDILTPNDAGCIIADIRMPGLDGLALQRRLKAAQLTLPVIFVSGYADVPLSVKAMQEGAFTMLTKPFREQELLDAVADALAWEREHRAERLDTARARGAYEELTVREREIMRAVTEGELNKAIASRLKLSEITIKVIRARVMKKMGVKSIAMLSRLAERLQRTSQS